MVRYPALYNSADPPDIDFLDRKRVVATPHPKMHLYASI